MEHPDASTVSDKSASAKSEALLIELFGPLADRIRGTGSKGAYVNLLLSSVFLRHRAKPLWAGIREDVREARDAQSAPQELLRIIGRRADAVLRKHRLPPGISTSFDDLRGEAIDDLAHVVRLCDDLRPKDFSALLDRFGGWMGKNDESFFTPRSVVDLMVQILSGHCNEGALIHDPYVRGGELLVGALGIAGVSALTGVGPSTDMLRLAGMNVLLNDGHAHLSIGNPAPWNRPATPGADLILMNPPFNDKGSSASRVREEDWIFGPPPGNHNYAWLQHVIVLLKRQGRAVVLMPNQAAVSADAREHLIRKRMIQAGAVEFMVALPRQLFATTTVPAMIWGLRAPAERPDSILLVDIRRAGSRQGKQRILDPAEIQAVADCLRLWRAGAEDFASVMHGIGHATGASMEEIERQDHSLDPSDYLADQLLNFGHQTLVGIPEIAAAVELRARQARMADEKAANIVIEHRNMDGQSAQIHWRRVQIHEICDMKSGPSHSLVKKALRADDGTPLIVPRDLRDHRILASKAERITEPSARALKRFQLKENDILIVRTGSVGPVALVAESEESWLFGTNIIRLRCHEDVDPGYLLAYLSSRSAQRWIQARTESATAIPSISAGSLSKLPVDLPPIDEQKRITDLLAKADVQIIAHRNFADAAEELRSLFTDGLTSGLLIANRA